MGAAWTSDVKYACRPWLLVAVEAASTTLSVSDTAPQAGDPVDGHEEPDTMQSQMDEIRRRCALVSDRHRRALPARMVHTRINSLARDAGDILQDRVVEICFLLDQSGPLRYNELRRLLGRISTRTLAAKLALLHEHELVVREQFDESPPRVEYRLSGRGSALTDLLFPTLVHLAEPGVEDIAESEVP